MDHDPRSNQRKLDASDVAARLGRWSDGAAPLYHQLADGLERLITQGVFRHHDRLPAERTLAAELSVSRGTVVAAYDRLRSDGRVQRTQGSGTHVVASPTGDVGAGEVPGDQLFAGPESSINLLLATATVLPRVLELVQSVRYTDHGPDLDTAEPAGLRALRRAIADHITESGLTTEPEQVVVTSGAQQAIALVGNLLAGPSDVVLTESTTWPGLAGTVEAAGARTYGVAMDRHGVIPDELAAAIERLRPAFIGLNPHHHNPTGTRLTPARREAVAGLAADYGVPLVEDRVTAHLAFDGRVPRPLAAETPGAAHFVVDSINKIAWPGLRIGWVRADVQAAQRLRSAKALADLYSPLPSQLMALRVLEHFDEVVQARVAQLVEQHEVLVHELARQLPEWDVPVVDGGLVAWVGLPRGSGSSFGKHAARYGVAVAGGHEFSAPTDDHLRIPFTAPPDVLRAGVTRLAEAWATYGDLDRVPGPAEPPTLI